MYRAIFLFDIDDLLKELDGAIVALRQRVPEVSGYSNDLIKKAWVFYHLWENVHLALSDDVDIMSVRGHLDHDFYTFNWRMVDRLSWHVGQALYPQNNPYYHHPCTISITKSDLRVFFDFGTYVPR